MVLEQVLHRSDELDDAIMQLLAAEAYRPANDTSRVLTSVGAAAVSIEHARALRCLIAVDHPSSAIALLRLQFEALTRAVWMLYAASDSDVSLAAAVLSPQTEKDASKLPGVSKMLTELGKTAAPQRRSADCNAEQVQRDIAPCTELFRPWWHTRAAATPGGISREINFSGAGVLKWPTHVERNDIVSADGQSAFSHPHE